jgi:hypothetical protein
LELGLTPCTAKNINLTFTNLFPFPAHEKMSKKRSQLIKKKKNNNNNNNNKTHKATKKSANQ